MDHATSASSALPAATRNLQLLPRLLPSQTATPGEEAPSLAVIGNDMGTTYGLPAEIGDNSTAHGPAVSLAPAPASKSPVTISSGVSQGMLLAPIQPVYPAIAKAAHVQGRVVVQATISATGVIESLHVVSGPIMLQSSALEAIRAARYRPYRLNGQPTAVMTTITVNFTFGT
jgi:protein TonB